MSTQKYLSPKEFSEQSGLSIATVGRYLRAGKLPYVQPRGRRGRVLIAFDALDRLAAERASRSATPSSPSALGEEGRGEQPIRRSGPLPAWRRDRAS
jgi:hypothetical protein